MNAAIGWVVAIVVALGVVAYFWWPQVNEKLGGNTPQEQGADSAQEQENVSPMMSGMWQSQTDAKFTREIRADGVIIDRNKGDASAGIHGEWSVVDPSAESGLAVPAASLAGMTVVKVVWEGGVETTYFAVNSLSETSMTITDLSGRGSVTTFAKI